MSGLSTVLAVKTSEALYGLSLVLGVCGLALLLAAFSGRWPSQTPRTRSERALYAGIAVTNTGILIAVLGADTTGLAIMLLGSLISGGITFVRLVHQSRDRHSP